MLNSVLKNKNKVKLPIKKIILTIERIQFDNIEYYQLKKINFRLKLNKKMLKVNPYNRNN